MNSKCRYCASIFLAAAFGGAALAISLQNKADIHSDLMIQAEQRADTNHDGITTRKEWEAVYTQLRIHYDAKRPYNLTNKNLLSYLSSSIVK